MSVQKWKRYSWMSALLGAAMLLGSPLPAGADPGGRGNGKWWKAEQDGKREQQRVERGSSDRRERGQVARQSPTRTERSSYRDRSSNRRSEQNFNRGGERTVNRGRDRGSSYRGRERSSSPSGDRTVYRRPDRNGDRAINRDRSVNRTGNRTTYRAPVRVRSGERIYTSSDRSYGYRSTYRAPVWRSARRFTGERYYRSWRGVPVYREYVYVSAFPRYRPAYGWRYYCPPRYYYPRHIVYVRPVRFFVAADFMIGGVHISGSYADPGDVYGCNFCDARFGDFHAYERHVEHCSHGPDGYTVMAQDWGHDQWDGWESEHWDRDDGRWEDDDEY